jgi:hypothetical protein
MGYTHSLPFFAERWLVLVIVFYGGNARDPVVAKIARAGLRTGAFFFFFFF